MNISVIIPTRNRADQLATAMDKILSLDGEAEFELIIVDNNSSDTTRETVCARSGPVRYVFEPRTAFSRARKTGGEAASGDILLFIDDDVEVFPGSLTAIQQIFERAPDCGIVGAKILPKFTEPPPDWTLACQRVFNGWSLWNPENQPFLGWGVQTCNGAAGPMMAVSRLAYDAAGGFPPDTVGVETDQGTKSFRKLYIGPGDGGLCHNVIRHGFRCYYSPKAACYHVIPPVRFTVPFWRSRLVGEGHYKATTRKMNFYGFSPAKRLKDMAQFRLEYSYRKQRFLRRLKAVEAMSYRDPVPGMLAEEVLFLFYRSYFEMTTVLHRYPGLSNLLWNIAANGVADNDFDGIMKRLPREYKELTDPERMYDPELVDSIQAFQRKYGKRQWSTR